MYVFLSTKWCDSSTSFPNPSDETKASALMMDAEGYNQSYPWPLFVDS